MSLLEVSDLKTHFRTDDGIVKAVDGAQVRLKVADLEQGHGLSP